MLKSILFSLFTLFAIVTFAQPPAGDARWVIIMEKNLNLRVQWILLNFQLNLKKNRLFKLK